MLSMCWVTKQANMLIQSLRQEHPQIAQWGVANNLQTLEKEDFQIFVFRGGDHWVVWGLVV